MRETPEQVYRNPDIFRIVVPLPNNPLRSLNCYVVKTDDGNLIIDTGFDQDACYEALSRGLRELDVDIKRTELFITHFHTDHFGLAFRIMPADGRIYLSSVDTDMYRRFYDPGYLDTVHERMVQEGLSEEEFAGFLEGIESMRFGERTGHAITRLNDGDAIQVGPFAFTAVATPGHTPGHLCLYLESRKLIFLGDHVLFDISPNIVNWFGFEDMLSQYLSSLQRIRAMDIQTCFVAHRSEGPNLNVRIDELIAHHAQRLREARRAIALRPGSTGEDVARRLNWNVHADGWDSIPATQRWFAMGETIAHLDHLVSRGSVRKDFVQGLYRYFVVPTGNRLEKKETSYEKSRPMK